VRVLGEHFFTWLPALLGGLFPLIVKLDQWLYKQGTIGVRGAIGMEFFFLALWCVAVLTALAVGAQMIQTRKWYGLLWVGTSIGVSLPLLGVGFDWGAAILHAT
jgi:hypothetical protein